MEKTTKETRVIVKKDSNQKALTKSLPASIQAEQLISQAISKGVSVETMERLLAMRRELKSEYAKVAFDRAMSDFQAECPTIQKTKKVLNKDGRTVRYAYAPIESIVEQVKPFLRKHGLSYTIDAPVEEKAVTAICRVTHEQGHSQTSSFKIPIDKDAYMNEAQKFASALTFAKRYAFCNAFGILTGDEDDGARAAGEDKSLYDIAWKMVQEANLRQLQDYRGKLSKSKKYTDQQKKDLLALVDKRVNEITATQNPDVTSVNYDEIPIVNA